MTPAEYATTIVIPTISEFQANRRDPRCAYLACMATYHLYDHLKAAGHRDAWAKMRTARPTEFEVLQAVCNGTKHSRDTKTSIGFAPGDERDRRPAIWGEAIWDVSRFDDEIGGLEIQHNGKYLDLFDCVMAVVAAYKQEFPDDLGGVDVDNPLAPSGVSRAKQQTQ